MPLDLRIWGWSIPSVNSAKLPQFCKITVVSKASKASKVPGLVPGLVPGKHPEEVDLKRGRAVKHTVFGVPSQPNFGNDHNAPWLPAAARNINYETRRGQG